MSKMKPLFLAVPGVLALAAGTLLPGCVLTNPANYTRTVTAQAAQTAAAPLKVRTGNGYIRVSRSASGFVEVSADAAFQTPQRRDAFAVRSELVGETWIVEPLWPDGKALPNERCAFTIALPDARSLDLETSNGEIAFAGFSGPAHAATSNGAIRVDSHDGTVDAATSNGAIELKLMTSAVSARTSNGHITIEFAQGATGPVHAKSSNGHIELHIPATFAGTLSASTSNGRVTADLAPGAKADLKKSSGSITFREGPETPAQPSSQPASTLETSNGGIHITQSAPAQR